MVRARGGGGGGGGCGGGSNIGIALRGRDKSAEVRGMVCELERWQNGAFLVIDGLVNVPLGRSTGGIEVPHPNGDEEAVTCSQELGFTSKE